MIWAKRATPEFRDWRRTLVEGTIPFAGSLLLLRYLLDPQGLREEAVIGTVSLVVGLLAIPSVRFLFNAAWLAPRRLVQARHDETWSERWSLNEERQQLVAEAQENLQLDVEIGGGPFVRPAQLTGVTTENDGKVYALQNTIITNRSASNVSLTFELWLPWAKHAAFLMLREHEHSGLGRTDPRYTKSPVNIRPQESSECKDIGFLFLPGLDAFIGREVEYDLKGAVLRVIDRVSKKQLDVPVRRSMGGPLHPPGWPTWP